MMDIRRLLKFAALVRDAQLRIGLLDRVRTVKRTAGILSGFALAGALAGVLAVSVAGKAGASITAGDGPFVFGQSYATSEVVASFEGKNGRNQPDGGYWARINCSQGGELVYAQFADLSAPIVQSGFTFGPTPSWSGGGADCVLLLFGMDSGAFNELATSAGFPALP